MKAALRSLDERLGHLRDKAGERFKKVYQSAKLPLAVGLGAATIFAAGSILPARKVEATPRFDTQVQIQTPSHTAFTSLEDVVNSPATSGTSTTSTAPLNTNWDEITLTDLEGNPIVYDNDGIKINFPPGFDMSVVGKIQVYRNGTHLPWLDDKLEITNSGDGINSVVITNSDMKTFKGDEKARAGMREGAPIVVTPPSSNTDHAIAGYTYGVAIFPKEWDGSFNWVAAKKTLTTTVESTFKWHPKEVWAHMDGAWMVTIHKLSYNDIVDHFKILKSDGFTGISFDMDYYMMTPYDNEVIELKTSDPRISQWGMKTPSLSELEEILKAISEVGLDARVMAMFSVSKSYMDAHKDRFIGKAMIDPKNPELFFENYTQLLEKIIPLLNKYNVKSLVVLDETDTLDLKYPDLIEDMLTTLSKEFSGKLGIDIAGNSMLGGWYWNQNGRSFKQLIDKMTFLGWKSPDGKKLEALYSCWTPPLETQKDQRVSVMTRNFVKFWKPLFDSVSSTYSNPPQGFGESGVYDADGVGLGPAYWSISNKVFDDQEMADIWYVYLKGDKELGINSLNIWQFPLGDYWGVWSPGNQFINIGIRKWPEMPAYRVITSIIGPNTSTSE